MIIMNIGEALKKLSEFHEKEMEKKMKEGGNNPFDKDLDVSFYNR